MFDDGNPIIPRSRIVALSATFHDGCITGLGCYAKRFNWFTNNVGECIYLKWKLQTGHASEKVVMEGVAESSSATTTDGDEGDGDDVEVFTNDVVVNLLSRLHDDGFRKVIRCLY